MQTCPTTGLSGFRWPATSNPRHLRPRPTRTTIATGFLALVPKAVDERVRELYLLNVADEQIDNIGRGILGLTVSCARCHDHKYDPIPTTDYYALAGILRSSETRDGLINRQRSGGETNRLIALATAPKDRSAAIRLATAEAAKAEKAWAERRKQLTILQQQANGGPAVGKVGGRRLERALAQALATDEQIKAMDQEVRALATIQDEKKSALARLTGLHDGRGRHRPSEAGRCVGTLSRRDRPDRPERTAWLSRPCWRAPTTRGPIRKGAAEASSPRG